MYLLHSTKSVTFIIGTNNWFNEVSTARETNFICQLSGATRKPRFFNKVQISDPPARALILHTHFLPPNGQCSMQKGGTGLMHTNEDTNVDGFPLSM